MDYRVEDKYFIYEDEMAFLKHRLLEIMKPDAHGRNGSYVVRSLYFDDLTDTAYRQIEAGTDPRSKFRLRTYDNDGTYILLEEKSKKRGFTHKESVVASRKTAEAIVCCNSPFEANISSGVLKNEEDFLFKKLYYNMNAVLLHPVVTVEYERTAYVEKAGNVRITFDTNIGAGKDVRRFFDDNVLPVPVLERGLHIMEIKYDEILPEYIRSAIDIGNLRKSAFSKYYYARNAVAD